MSCGTRQGCVPVLLVGCNPLALEYLSATVRQDPTLEITRVEALASRSDKQGMTPVFVVDNCGLQIPLSECVKRAQYSFPKAKCLVLGPELDHEALLQLVWIKIDGFIPYREVRQSLLQAIHSVALGRIWFPRDILREYVHNTREGHLKTTPAGEAMTSRETQILELVKRRLSNKEIAEILQIRESTVKFHLSNIYSKIRVSSRRELVRDGWDRSGAGEILSFLSPLTSKT